MNGEWGPSFGHRLTGKSKMRLGARPGNSGEPRCDGFEPAQMT
jgi:hypothetical protein